VTPIHMLPDGATIAMADGAHLTVAARTFATVKLSNEAWVPNWTMVSVVSAPTDGTQI
jgi:hypothetical protein